MVAETSLLKVSGSNLDTTLTKLYHFSHIINGTQQCFSKIY